MSKNYQRLILGKLLDCYERRGLYDSKIAETSRAVIMNVGKEFPEYSDTFNDQAYRDIDSVVKTLIDLGLVEGNSNVRGVYSKLRLCPLKVNQCYQILGRIPLSKVRGQLLSLLREYSNDTSLIVQQFCADQNDRLQKHSPIAFGIGDDSKKLQQVLSALSAILQLEQETYIRNFSEAIFHNSKQFQKIRSIVERILWEYGDVETERKNILESFNLFDNPAYIFIKGKIRIIYSTGEVDVSAVPGGMALPSRSLDEIRGIQVNASCIITVENLTTYHDTPENDKAVLYLGGFHNTARNSFLKKLYAENSKANYFHKGDLDVYGFLILENLKEKTGINFEPLEMDLDTLQKCFAAGHYQPLSPSDKKAMESPKLCSYREILEFMLQHNCKVEQEAFEAMKLSV